MSSRLLNINLKPYLAPNSKNARNFTSFSRANVTDAIEKYLSESFDKNGDKLLSPNELIGFGTPSSRGGLKLNEADELCNNSPIAIRDFSEALWLLGKDNTIGSYKIKEIFRFHELKNSLSEIQTYKENSKKVYSEILKTTKKHLKQYPGIVLGDCHVNYSITDFLLANMNEFKKMGIETIYMEMLEHDERKIIRNYIEARNNYKNSETKENLETYRHYRRILQGNNLSDYNHGTFRSIELLNVIDSAIDSGIKVVGIDDTSSKYFIHNDIRKNKKKYTEAQQERNKRWSEVINNDQNNAAPDSKYLVFSGLHHSSADQGIDALLNIPSIDIDTTKNISQGFSQSSDGTNWYQAYLPKSPFQINKSANIIKGDFLGIGGHWTTETISTEGCTSVKQKLPSEKKATYSKIHE